MDRPIERDAPADRPGCGSRNCRPIWNRVETADRAAAGTATPPSRSGIAHRIGRRSFPLSPEEPPLGASRQRRRQPGPGRPVSPPVRLCRRLLSGRRRVRAAHPPQSVQLRPQPPTDRRQPAPGSGRRPRSVGSTSGRERLFPRLRQPVPLRHPRSVAAASLSGGVPPAHPQRLCRQRRTRPHRTGDQPGPGPSPDRRSRLCRDIPRHPFLLPGFGPQSP